MGPRDSAGVRFTVGGMNLRNLVLPNQSYYGNKGYTDEEYARKVAWTADQLTRMECGLVGLQELFHPKAFDDILAKVPHMHGATLVSRGDSGHAPVVALLSNYPVLSVRSIKAIPRTAKLMVGEGAVPIKSFSRPILNACVEIGGTQIDVWVAHLKSKRAILEQGEDRNDPYAIAVGEARALIHRATEAVGLRHLMVAHRRRSKRPAILIGDMNDGPGAVTTRVITGQDPWKKLPDKLKRQVWSFRMWDVVELREKMSFDSGGHFTHIFNGYYERLDGIYVSNEFHPICPLRIGRVEEVRVFNDHLRDQTIAFSDQPLWESDHGQITANIVLGS